MKDELIHEPTGRTIDLAGRMDAVTFTWLESLQGSSPRSKPTLWCGGCGGGLYLRHDPRRRDRLHGVHYVKTQCRDLVINHAVMSDEHKYECEYHALAGQAAGFPADLEVVTTGNTRVDVVVGQAGFEIQRSGLKVSAAKDRTKRSMAAGLNVVSWFTDRPTPPPWWAKVPSYSTTIRSWDQLPKPRTVTARGPQVINMVRCVIGAFPKCPQGNRRPCGQYHEKYEPWRGLLVDDVVAMMASGEMVAAQTGKYVRLISSADLRRYEELADKPARYGGTLPVQPGPQAPNGRVECTQPIQPGWFIRPENCQQLEFDLTARPLVVLAAKRGTCNTPGCGEPGRPYPAGFRCDQHKPRPYLAKGA